MGKSLILDENGVRRFKRFLRRNPVTGCLEFTGNRLPKGYGIFGLGPAKAGSAPAHRVAFVLGGGVITDENPVVLHACDNPSCCEFSHLRAGTLLTNNRDMARKGRGHGSKTGLPFGVKPRPNGRFAARSRLNGKQTHLGAYDTWQEASAIAHLHKNLAFNPDLSVN